MRIDCSSVWHDTGDRVKLAHNRVPQVIKNKNEGYFPLPSSSNRIQQLTLWVRPWCCFYWHIRNMMSYRRKSSSLQSLLLLLQFTCGAVIALVAPNPSAPSATTRSIPQHFRILILPGFGNDAQDYISPSIVSTNEASSAAAAAASSSGSFVNSLLRRGWQPEQIHVLPVQRYEWLQVFLYGCFDLQFWQGTAPPTNPAFCWYLQRVQAVMESFHDDDQAHEVVLIGHSAGGWLGRAALGTPAVSQRVRALVTLGTPNQPHPTMDMTRGALRWTHDTYPGAYPHASERKIRYLTVCGTAVTGQPESERRSERFAYNSYEAVCGVGETLGDGLFSLASFFQL
jgi:PGAP1-like protein